MTPNNSHSSGITKYFDKRNPSQIKPGSLTRRNKHMLKTGRNISGSVVTLSRHWGHCRENFTQFSVILLINCTFQELCWTKSHVAAWKRNDQWTSVVLGMSSLWFTLYTELKDWSFLPFFHQSHTWKSEK